MNSDNGFDGKNRTLGPASRDQRGGRPPAGRTPASRLAAARLAVEEWEAADAVLSRISRLAAVPMACGDGEDTPIELLHRAAEAQDGAARAVRLACGLPEKSRNVATIGLEDGRLVTALPFGQYIEDGPTSAQCLVVSDRTAGLGDRELTG